MSIEAVTKKFRPNTEVDVFGDIQPVKPHHDKPSLF